MEKNYYDILEINRNASQEIVEKAYKTLAKKYHPDLQEDGSKYEYEEKLKLINEAYDVLSDPQKRAVFDEELLQKESLNNTINTSQNTVQEQKVPEEPDYDKELKQQEFAFEQERLAQIERLKYEQEVQQAREKAYHDAYIQDLKNRGYKIRYKKSLKDYIKGLACIIITIAVLIVLWQIPFIQNFFIDLYNNNEAIHSSVDLIFNLFK